MPQTPWFGNEVEKRDALFRLGHAVAEPREDWLVVADADEVWKPGHDLYDGLTATDLDVAEIMLEERVGAGGHEWNRQMIRKCFRAHPRGIRVEGAHYRYVNGDGLVLWGGYAEEPCEQLMDVRVRHRPGDREIYRDRKRLAYYERRTSAQIETAQ